MLSNPSISPVSLVLLLPAAQVTCNRGSTDDSGSGGTAGIGIAAAEPEEAVERVEVGRTHMLVLLGVQRTAVLLLQVLMVVLGAAGAKVMMVATMPVVLVVQVHRQC